MIPPAETFTAPLAAAAAVPEHEIKLIVPPFGEQRVADLLGCLCRPVDDYPDGRVGSLYFDTPELHLLGEKLASHYRKSKVRLRWYPTADRLASDPCYLELKQRRGTVRGKVRHPVPVPAPADLRLGPGSRLRLAELPARLRTAETGAFGQPVGGAGQLLPIVSFVYRRRRFVEPASGWRVNLDSGGKVLGADPLRVPGIAGRPMSWTIVELKGPAARIPARLAPLVWLGCRRSSFSKYSTVCRPA